jgi:hypothetical protein
VFVPTAVRTPDFLPTPIGGTPDTLATSQAVILTITALAATPTVPLVPTRAPSRPIGAGPKNVRVTTAPTPTLDKTGVSLLSVSDKVYRGGAGALTIRTRPNAACILQIARAQSDGSVKAAPIPDGASRAAGRDGVVAWIWNIGGDETPGKVTLVVDCGQAGSAQFGIEVGQ